MVSELRNAVLTILNGKAPGQDKIVVEMLKSFSDLG